MSEECWNAGKLSESVLVPIFLKKKNAFRLIRATLEINQGAENQAPTPGWRTIAKDNPEQVKRGKRHSESPSSGHCGSNYQGLAGVLLQGAHYKA